MMSDNEKNNGYEVGYRKPPRHTRFRPGQSGNPKGRKKKKVGGIGDRLKAEFAQTVRAKIDGKEQNIDLAEAMVKKLINDALNGKPADTIRLLAAVHKYAPDLLKASLDPEISEITIQFIESDNYGRPLDMTEEEQLAMKEMAPRAPRAREGLAAAGKHHPAGSARHVKQLSLALSLLRPRRGGSGQNIQAPLIVRVPLLDLSQAEILSRTCSGAIRPGPFRAHSQTTARRQPALSIAA